MPAAVEKILQDLEASKSWPPERERDVKRTLDRWVAWRTNDKDYLKAHIGWDKQKDRDGRERDYVTDPLASVLASAFADFLFSEEPTVRAADEKDQEALNRIVESNNFAAQLHHAEEICVSEGEVWYKIYTDSAMNDAPSIDWVSRRSVIPYWRNKQLVAAVFWEQVAVEDDDVYRRVEVYLDGETHNRLYLGDKDHLGRAIDLEQRYETDGYADVWRHGLPILAGRVLNKQGLDWRLGESIYEKVEDLLFSLNETVSIGQENTRLTAKKRLFVAGKLTQQNWEFDAGDDIIQVNQQDEELGADKTPPISAVEYSYDAEPLLKHKEDQINTILARVGLIPQIVGNNIDGQAESGTAIRLRFLPTVNASAGKARGWDDVTPKVLQLLMRVDALGTELYGYGRPYVDPMALPTFQRGTILPTDQTELIQNEATAVTAGVRSQETAIRNLNPGWDDDKVLEELQRIQQQDSLLLDTTESLIQPAVSDDSGLPTRG